MKINYISLMDLKDVYPLWEKGSRRFGWEFCLDERRPSKLFGHKITRMNNEG